MNHPDSPEKISQFPVSLAEAVAKAEKLIGEHKAYLEDVQNGSTTLRSFKERAISMFTELQEAMNADIESVGITETNHLMEIFNQSYYFIYSNRVNSGSRFIINYNLGIINNCPGYSYPFPHPAA